MPDHVIHWNGRLRWALPNVKLRRWVGRSSRLFVLEGPNVRVAFDYRRFKGLAILGISRRRTASSPWYLVRQQEFPDVKKPKLKDQDTSVRHLAAMETEMFKDAMPLVEHCAMIRYDDGEGRKNGKFFVEVQGRSWKVTVKDLDTSCQFVVVDESLDRALQGAALLLACEDAPWEPDTWALERQSKKKK